MFSKKIFFGFVGVFVALRIFSYFFGPPTPLFSAHPFNTALSLGIMAAVAYLLWRQNIWGWYLVILELVLGGSGGYLAIYGVSLRTTLLVVSLAIFFIQKIETRNLVLLLKTEKNIMLLFGIFSASVLISAFIGVKNGHALSSVMVDCIPYLFIGYYFPFKELLKNSTTKKIILNALAAAVVGNVLLLLYTLFTFAAGFHYLQDFFYHWYRDIALGKITELPFHYYRLVLNEHLLLVPTMLLLLNWLLHTNQSARDKRWLWGLVVGLLVILAVNLTRIYLLALAIGYLALFTAASFKRWLATGAALLAVFIVLFTSMHLAASRGQSLGWELFGLRLQSITSPSLEESSLSRLLLLPKIIEKIKSHPVLGTGFGDTVTVYSPVFKKDITTPHFDWGYLEILAEMGIVGLLVWLSFIFYLLNSYKNGRLSRGQFTALFALLIINLTSPALFHVFGSLFLAYLLASAESTKI